MLALFAVISMASGCVAPATPGGAIEMSSDHTLDEVALRRLFLSGQNTYIAPIRSADVTISHPPSELFRVNGTYARTIRRFPMEGAYSLEGNRLCVSGKQIPRQCRTLSYRGDGLYILTDVADGTQVLRQLWQK